MVSIQSLYGCCSGSIPDILIIYVRVVPIVEHPACIGEALGANPSGYICSLSVVVIILGFQPRDASSILAGSVYEPIAQSG